ncbi:unnamed protein product [Danaus chrysippus]|uniref:(African queen) hypothetical protein n=1 Tax=Danaus chrysippus TaxID=151541 RepID=A0A8J2QL93_9NEOP|nr:unnamed protein product [Danaus chrysippus]
MRLFLIIALCADLTAKFVVADGEFEVKRGVFPFMAFVYYPDKTVVDSSGIRLKRGAVLIRPDWLVTSSLEDGQISLAFPKETLVARLGAIRIDSKFTLFEDEDEQEREIIQIARPQNYSAMEWWFADISLLKTLLPFNITAAVGPAIINTKPRDADKSCFILVYAAPNGNASDDRMLMQLSIEILGSSPENCGSNYMRSMMCGTNTDDTRKYPGFCEGNSGGPLVCDNEVIAIQTYFNDCKPPHRYQILGAWDNLITCALEDKCKEEQCARICSTIHKDSDDVVIPEKTLSEEAKIHSDDENISTTDGQEVGQEVSSTPVEARRLLQDNSHFLSFNSGLVHTDSPTANSTEAQNTKETVLSSEVDTTEKSTSTTNDHTDEEQQDAITKSPSAAVTMSPETENMPVYKTMESESSVPENLIENSQQEEPPQRPPLKVRSEASINVNSFYFMLILAMINFT